MDGGLGYVLGILPISFVSVDSYHLGLPTELAMGLQISCMQETSPLRDPPLAVLLNTQVLQICASNEHISKVQRRIFS